MIERLIGVQLSLTHFFGYKAKKELLEAWILREFTGSETDDDLILRAVDLFFYFLEVISEVPLICDEIVEYHYPERVMRQFARDQYIPALFDTRLDLHWIQLTGNDHTYWRTQHASDKVDDMATGVIEGPPSSPIQMSSAWYLLEIPWVALHLRMIFNRHF
ncbi:hypothetical protein M9H77_36405 [Catharanthus roseus]|uniref:Uncharacterized protein n=1 Tax=Catharanthus roseus TaxID=4058 RepID=A0ACB9ZSJ8_CATRO|nr:hypothetical protein M9H77_36405 [Catharanthus roseus]